MASYQKGKLRARKDFTHLRRVSRTKDHFLEGIKTYISHHKNIYDPEFIRGYRDEMLYRWGLFSTGGDWRTPRIPGLKPRDTNENVLARAYRFLNN